MKLVHRIIRHGNIQGRWTTTTDSCSKTATFPWWNLFYPRLFRHVQDIQNEDLVCDCELPLKCRLSSSWMWESQIWERPEYVWAFCILTCENKSSEDMRICWRLVVLITTNGTWGLNQARIWIAVKMFSQKLLEMPPLDLYRVPAISHTCALCITIFITWSQNGSNPNHCDPRLPGSFEWSRLLWCYHISTRNSAPRRWLGHSCWNFIWAEKSRNAAKRRGFFWVFFQT